MKNRKKALLLLFASLQQFEAWFDFFLYFAAALCPQSKSQFYKQVKTIPFFISQHPLKKTTAFIDAHSAYWRISTPLLAYCVSITGWAKCYIVCVPIWRQNNQIYLKKQWSRSGTSTWWNYLCYRCFIFTPIAIYTI